jgi:uncharacterized protein
MQAELEALRDLVRPVFKGEAGGPHTLYLYGSRATGTANAGSDYDFALIAPLILEQAELEGIRESLSEILPGRPDVDCVDLRRIPLTLAAQILETGIVLFCEDEPERARLETRLLSMYASLNEERREILEDIAPRGSVYAR